MQIRKDYNSVALKSKIIREDIIAGEKDFSYINRGYRMTSEGLDVPYRFQPVEPEVTISNAKHAKYFPVIRYSFLLNSQGGCYRWKYEYSSKLNLIGLTGISDPFFISCNDSKERVIITAGYRLLELTTNDCTTYLLPFNLRCGCFHHGRIFSSDQGDRYMIRWSTFEPTDWSEEIDGGGWLRLSESGGKIVDMVEYNDRIVVLRERGLTVIKGYGDMRHYVVEPVITIGTETVRVNTCAVCRGKLYFCSDMHIYVYDGNTVSLFRFKRDGDVFNFRSVEVCDDRYLYYCCESIIAEGDYVYEIDLETGYDVLFCPDSDVLWHTPDRVYCVIGNKLYWDNLASGTDICCHWETKPIDFGDANSFKTLRKVVVENRSGDAVLSVTADGITRVIEGTGEIVVGLRGRQFTFNVDDVGHIGRVTAEWEVTQ